MAASKWLLPGLMTFFIFMAGASATARHLSQTNTTPGFSQEVLALHNKYRATHKAPPLVWDANLAAQAQRYAASTGCKMKHSGMKGVGENLALGATPTGGIKMWYDEVSKYNFNKPGFSMATGHFTQVVWKGTQRLGCGYVSSCKFLVCQYSPAGNMQGQFPANVAPAS